MTKAKRLKEFRKADFLAFFEKADENLAKLHQKLEVTILGGAAIVLLGFKDRATFDIDIAPPGEELFIQFGKTMGIPVETVSVVTTVDFVHCEKEFVYSGKSLTVLSISPQDLVKSKLERFQRQDPDDIYTLLEKTKITYEVFRDLVKEMLLDFVGNPIKLLMHARTTVEQIYPEKSDEFCRDIK